MLHESVLELLELDTTFVDEYNATTLLMYSNIINDLIKIIYPTAIVEVGAERGLTSEFLKTLACEINADFYSVDPCYESSYVLGNFHVLAEKSSAFLARNITSNFVLLDGDHNYQTVTEELVGFSDRSDKEHPHCFILHDIGWPWARRDIWYDKEAASDFVENVGVCLEEPELVRDRGLQSGYAYCTRKTYGGERNGVLTAVEDFVETRPEFEFMKIPGPFGLGILLRNKGKNTELAAYFDHLELALKCLGPLLNKLEANRLRLLQGLRETEIDRELFHNVAEERLSELQRVGAERDELYNIAEERLSELQRIKK